MGKTAGLLIQVPPSKIRSGNAQEKIRGTIAVGNVKFVVVPAVQAEGEAKGVLVVP